MQYTYRGESPSKKVARLRYWEGVRRRLGTRFRNVTHLVLAGPDAGDVQVLLGMGVPPKNIYSFDTDALCVLATQETHPRINSFHGDVFECARECPPFGSALFDFCAPMYNHTLQALRSFMQECTRSKAVVGCTFQLGREMEFSEELRSHRRVLGESSPTWSASTACRVRLLDQQLSMNLGRSLQSCSALYYNSRTATYSGRPMYMYMGQLDVAPTKELELLGVGRSQRCTYTAYDEAYLAHLTRELLREKKPAQQLLALTNEEFGAFRNNKTVCVPPTPLHASPVYTVRRHNPVNIAFGLTLVACRRDANVPAQALSEHLAVSRHTLSNWESGHTAPSQRVYEELLTFLPALRQYPGPACSR